MPDNSVHTDGFIGPFLVPEEGVPIAIINDSSAPQLGVEEDAAPTFTAVSNSVAIMTISGMQVNTGKVTQLRVEKKLTSGSDWENCGSYATPDDWEEGKTPSTFTFNIPGIKAIAPGGLSWDFRVWFYNSDGQLATSSSAPTTPYDITATHDFNGVDDVAEIFEVMNLSMVGNNVGKNRVATLTWDDAKYYGSGIDYHAESDYLTANDGGTPLTYADNNKGGTAHVIATGDLPDSKLAKVSAYEIFMYVSDTNAMPTNQNPVKDSGDAGDWYHVKTVNSWPMNSTGSTIGRISADVTCPAGKYVSFWVGARTPNVKSNADAIENKYDYSQA